MQQKMEKVSGTSSDSRNGSASKQGNCDDNAKLIAAFEQTMKELQFKVKQQERDISFKEEEVKHYKKIARDLAEKLEACAMKEQELTNALDKKDEDLEYKEKTI
mmetsp:Transcript_36295/g.26926  ORF Transcript_36295/g.26926 Transcript_36295/m.26926 type:complete len:104 (+) Transcript_36295:268-579(+)